MAVVTVTAGNFDQEVLQSTETVLVDFWASWCGPCKMLSPMVDQVAEERPDIKVCKINVDGACRPFRRDEHSRIEGIQGRRSRQ